MVSKKRIQNFVAKRWKKLLKNFRAACLSPDPEAVHDLRVEAKKLKAVAILLHQTNGKAESLPLQQMKPFIRQTANIREAELHLKTFSEYDLMNPELRQEQEMVIANGYALIHAGRQRFKKDIKAVMKRFSQAAKPLKNAGVENYFASSIDEIIWHFLWPLDKEQLHEGRMKVKNLIYTVDLLPEKLQKKIKLNVRYLDRVQGLIGLWHDLNLTLALLSRKQLTEEPAFEMIKKKEADLLEQIKTELQYFDKKVVILKK